MADPDQPPSPPSFTISEAHEVARASASLTQKKNLQDLPVDIINQLANIAPADVLKNMRLISRKMNSMALHEFYRRISTRQKITLNELSIGTMGKMLAVDEIAKRLVKVIFAIDTFGSPSLGKDLTENGIMILQKKDDEMHCVYRRELPYLFEIMVELPSLAEVSILKEAKHIRVLRERYLVRTPASTPLDGLVRKTWEKFWEASCRNAFRCKPNCPFGKQGEASMRAGTVDALKAVHAARKRMDPLEPVR
jgi:hypothetical protein